MRIVVLRFALFLLGAAGLARAQGGPPFITDDPGTPGNGHWEINVAWTHEHREDGSTDELPLLDLNYGLGDRVQLKYEASHLVVLRTEMPRETGWSNSLAGVKWRFFDDANSGLSVSTYPQVEFRNPDSRSAARGLTADETTFLLPFEIQREKNGWGLDAEFGAVVPSRSASSWMYGVVLGRECSERVEVGVELHGEGSAHFERTVLTANLGARYKITTRCLFLGSIGRECHNGFESPASLVSYVAVQLLR